MFTISIPFALIIQMTPLISTSKNIMPFLSTIVFMVSYSPPLLLFNLWLLVFIKNIFLSDSIRVATRGF